MTQTFSTGIAAGTAGDTARRSNEKRNALIIFTLLFYPLWALFEFYGRPFLAGWIDNAVLCQLVKSGIVKNLFWTAPALLLVRRYSSGMLVPLREMFSVRTDWSGYLPLFIAFTVAIPGGEFLRNGSVRLSEGFGVCDIIVVLFVGLTEEAVFRGLLLNASLAGADDENDADRKKRYCLAVMLNAFMFMLIHFPIWICSGTFVSVFTSFGFVTLLVLSALFSTAFIKSRNLLVPIALHMYWDLLAFMFT